MNHSTFTRRGGTPIGSSSRHLVSAVVIALTSTGLQAADDAYLQLLDEEVTKVEAVPTDTGGDDAARPADMAGDADAQAVPSRQSFEALLREQHVGTYSFYRKLPERSREEVFIDYRNGASMEALRQKIIDRFLHP